jgi:hypothetical protein
VVRGGPSPEWRTGRGMAEGGRWWPHCLVLVWQWTGVGVLEWDQPDVAVDRRAVRPGIKEDAAVVARRADQII